MLSEAIVQLFAITADRLLRQGNWRENIDEVLPNLGIATSAWRVYLLERATNVADDVRISAHHEWLAADAASVLAQWHGVRLRAAGFARWVEAMDMGEVIAGTVREFPARERTVLVARGVHSLVAAPAAAGQKWEAILVVEGRGLEHVWTATEIQVVTTIASMLGAAIKRQQVEDVLARCNRKFILVRNLLAATNAKEGPNIVEVLVRELAHAFAARWTVALSVSGDKNVAKLIAEHPRTAGRVTGWSITIADTVLVSEVMKMRRPLLIEDVASEPRLGQLAQFVQACGGTALLALPLAAEEDVIGAVVLASTTAESLLEGPLVVAELVASAVARYLAQQKIAVSQRLLAAAVAQSRDSFVVTDADGTIIYANPVFENTVGLSAQQMIGQNLFTKQNVANVEQLHDDLKRAICIRVPWRSCYRVKSQKGKPSIVDVSLVPIRDDQNIVRNFVCISRDVTSEMQIKEQLLQIQKLDCIGRLAAGVAHDFNNILATITGFAGLAMAALPTHHRAYEDLREIQEVAQRGAVLSSHLLTFSRRQISEPQIINLNELILNVKSFLRPLMDEKFVFITHLWPSPIWVNVDPSQFEQVLLNLAINARDAMPQGGTMTVTTRLFVGSSKSEKPTDLVPGEYVELDFSDTGCGMTEEVLAHAFEPFFTTKSVGRGSGIGLAICYGIVTQHGGRISLESTPGGGTTVRIVFPTTKEVYETGNKVT